MRRVAVSMLLCAAMVCGGELPVTQVVLYKHGVGFFERAGTLAAGESARLDFTAAEMNDVLKSLTIEERGGGKITGLRYDSMDLLTHTLSAFPFQIGNAEPLSGMLDRLKGERLELKFGNDTVAGVVVNGRMAPNEHEQLTLLLDSGELRNVDLGAASSIRFSDPRLQLQFRDYLTAVAAARSKEKRSVYIDSTDAKGREVKASYMVPAPVWKSSYRLIFGGAAQPVLEGWAIVDNTTSEDWTKVQLSLVSGRPISFVSQLYAPKYINRPGAELADDRAARPVVHSGLMDAKDAAALALRDQNRMQQQFLKQQAKSLGSVAEADLPAAPPAASPSTIVADSMAQELGELFEYRIAQPVTIRKNESAMLPFLQQPIDARKLLIYSDHSSTHPTNAAELINATGKTLDGGPVTIYDGGAYGGEALMETLKSGDRRLVSYAVDLGTRITEAFGSKQAVVREIHLNRGILTTRAAAEETRTYTVHNVDPKEKTLIIEHPLRPGYVLLNQKASRKTADAYRFEIQVPAGATQEFPVEEERVYSESASVSNLTPDTLLSYVSNRALSDVDRRQLRQISDQKKLVAENAGAIQDTTRQIQDATNDENRIRQNIGSLNSVSGQQQLVQTYARQLDTSEQQLAALRDKQADLQRKKASLESGLNRLIESLSF